MENYFSNENLNKKSSLEHDHGFILDEEIISKISRERVEGNFEVTYNGDSVIFNSPDPLGAGGSKQVYDVKIAGKDYALALPAAGIDSADIIKNKWEKVLKEPHNTTLLRDLGFHVNTRSEIIEVTINNSPFPALLMARYQDLPFEVRDSKNKLSSTGNSQLFTNGFSSEGIDFVVSHIKKELDLLVEKGIILASDSFNICTDQDKAYLYLNDLDSTKIKKLTEDNIPRVKASYAMFAGSALIEAMTNEEYKALQNSPYADSFEDLLIERLTK